MHDEDAFDEPSQSPLQFAPDELPPDSDDPEHRAARVRQLLRGRTDPRAKKILESSDRLYSAEMRASKHPEQELTNLKQALCASVELYVLAAEELREAQKKQMDILARYPSAEQVGRVAMGAEKLERLAEGWDQRVKKLEQQIDKAAQAALARLQAEGSESVEAMLVVFVKTRDELVLAMRVATVAAVISMLVGGAAAYYWYDLHKLVEERRAAPSSYRAP